VFRTVRIWAAISMLASPLAAQQSYPPFTSSEAAAWREDLRFLAVELPRRHPNAFYRTPRERFDSAVAALDARLPSMRRHEAIVGLMQIVALVRDGHTSINPIFDDRAAFHYFPVEFYLFKDGLFVRRAASDQADLVGARVLRVGQASTDSAIARVATVISHENDQWVKALAPFFLAIPEVLNALGVTPDLESVTLEVEQGGTRRTVTVHSAGALTPQGHGPNGPINTAGWTDMRQPGEQPLYQQQPEKLYWMQYLPDSKTLYVAFRAVVPMADDPLPGFFTRLFVTADSLKPQRLVLDMRDNGGGNNFFNKQFVLGVIRRTWLDQPGHFYCIIGRRTFSAAQNMVNELERYTNITFVGEPTGNAPNMYGDARQITLPNSKITVNISSIYWQTMNPTDPRLYVPPAIATELTSADYRANVDPAMRAILRRAAEKPLTSRMAELVAAGDTVGAEQLLKGAIADPENTWRNLEAEVNTKGYELLGSRHLPDAVAILAINTRVYPQSANVWDSYGESLENAGKRELAIAAYRKALALEPRTGSSRAGLLRLGVQP
jgi:hypothetical protein